MGIIVIVMSTILRYWVLTQHLQIKRCCSHKRTVVMIDKAKRCLKWYSHSQYRKKFHFISSHSLLSFLCLPSSSPSLFPYVLSVSLFVVSGIFQKDVPQISRTSFWVTIKMILQTYKTCREVTFFCIYGDLSLPADTNNNNINQYQQQK